MASELVDGRICACSGKVASRVFSNTLGWYTISCICTVWCRRGTGKWMATTVAAHDMYCTRTGLRLSKMKQRFLMLGSLALLAGAQERGAHESLTHNAANSCLLVAPLRGSQTRIVAESRCEPRESAYELWRETQGPGAGSMWHFDGRRRDCDRCRATTIIISAVLETVSMKIIR